MAQLADQTKIINATELPIGVHKVENGEINGYKYFEKCRVRTWVDWLTGKQREYGICWARVSVKEGGEIVRPLVCGTTSLPSDDFRTDKLDVDDIVTPDGYKCSSAVSPFCNMEYNSNQTYKSSLDTRLDRECVIGLHFFPTMEALKNYVGEKSYSITTYDHDGQIIGYNNNAGKVS